MPIRIRTKENKSVILDESARFLEIVNNEGTLLTVVYPDADEIVVVASPGDPLFDKYCRLFKIDKVGNKIVKLDR